MLVSLLRRCLAALEEGKECAELAQAQQSDSSHGAFSDELRCRIKQGTESRLAKSSPNMLVNGKDVFKASAARVMFDPGMENNSRNDRLMRVRAFSEPGKKPVKGQSALVGRDSSDDSFVQGDLFATLVVVKSQVGAESHETVCLCVCVADKITTTANKKKQVQSSIETAKLTSAMIRFNIVNLTQQELNAVDTSAGEGQLWAGRPVLTGGEVSGRQIVLLGSQLLRVGDQKWALTPCFLPDEGGEDDGVELGGGKVEDKSAWHYAFEEGELQSALEVLELQR